MRLAVIAVVALMNSASSWAIDIQDNRSLLLFADQLASVKTHNDRIRYNEVRAVEELIHRGDQIAQEIRRDGNFKRQLSTTASLEVDRASRTIRFRSTGYNFTQTVRGDDLHQSWNKMTATGRVADERTVNADSFEAPYYNEIRQELYGLTLRSRNLSELSAGPLREITETPQAEQEAISEVRLDIRERMFGARNRGDSTRWKFVPVKLVAYPFQKIMYDLPAMVTSTVTESVTRSPWDNLRGSVDEFRGAVHQAWVGFTNIFRGVLNPRRATAVDGALEVVDSSFRVAHGILGLGKTAVSIVGYPLYRVSGGERSRYVPLRGKRATVIIVDTAYFDGFNQIMDTYGETIVRGQLAAISSYMCISHTAQLNSIENCIDNVPADVPYIDLVALTHTGGMSQLDRYAQYARDNKGLQPELMISIACYDNPSGIASAENTMGQQGTSWAVHFYLTNLLSKRLRGMPMEQAANEAFFEGYATNAIKPVSWGGMFVTGGYNGSRPDLIADDVLVQRTLDQAWSNVRYSASELRYSRMSRNKEQKLAELDGHLNQIAAFHARVRPVSTRTNLSDESRAALATSERRLAEFTQILASYKAAGDETLLSTLLDNMTLLAAR